MGDKFCVSSSVFVCVLGGEGAGEKYWGRIRRKKNTNRHQIQSMVLGCPHQKDTKSGQL